MKTYSDEELVLKVQKGEEEAFNILYKRYRQRLEFIALRLCQNQEDAKDVVQQTFLQAHSSITSLREPKRFYNWCCKILHGKCTDLFRKNKDVVVDAEHSPLFTSIVEERQEFNPQKQHRFMNDRKILLSFINQLPYAQRQVILLVYFEQMSMQECAEVLDVPEGTVKSRLYTAKNILKAKVEEYNNTSHSPLNFQDIISGSLISMALISAWKSYRITTLVPKGKLFQANPAAFFAGTIAISSVIGVSAWNMLQETSPKETPIQISHSVIEYHGKEITNEKEAYFTLRNWAVDERQMIDRDENEISEAMQLYDYLKQSNSEYYHVLQQDDWASAFEQMRP